MDIVCPSRRTVALGLSAALSACAHPAPNEGAEAALAALEARAGGRLGVAVVDERGEVRGAWRGDERFGLCSTFKLPLAAAVLREADAGRLALSEAQPIAAADFVPHAPVTKPAFEAGRPLTLVELAEAAQKTSDNVAANLLIRRLGGPAAVTALWRAMGDPETRLDRLEPEMNTVAAGDPRDTTTPVAMARLALRLAHGDALSEPARARLAQWMAETETGLKRLRAGLPAGWRAGDKTGTVVGPDLINRYNDVAVIWPNPGQARGGPFAVAAYYEAAGTSETVAPENEAVLAEVGRLAADLIAARRPTG